MRSYYREHSRLQCLGNAHEHVNASLLLLQLDGYDGDLNGVEVEQEPLDEPITQEDAWQVISSYFAEKGLVRQQLGKHCCATTVCQ
jgi:hypothetical protein